MLFGSEVFEDLQNSRLCRRFPRAPGVPPSTAVKNIDDEIGAPTAIQMVLNFPQGHEDSEYVLSFEMGQREGGFYSARTDRQIHRHTQYRISI